MVNDVASSSSSAAAEPAVNQADEDLLPEVDSTDWEQIAIDAVVLAAASVFLQPHRLFWSAISAAMMASVVYLWHRPGRYTGTSISRWRWKA